MIKPVFVEGKNIDDVWFKLLVELKQHGRKNKIDSGSFADGNTYRLEFDFVAGTIQQPIQYTDIGIRAPLAVTVPAGCPAPTSEEKIEEYFVNYLMDGAVADNEHYKYATFIVGGDYLIPRMWMSAPFVRCKYPQEFKLQPEAKGPIVRVPNQLEWAINHYKKAGFGNNHCTIQVGYPESQLAYDIKYNNESERHTSPCLRLIDTKIIEENGEPSLHFTVYFRSWDLYAGFPENMGGFALLMEYMASELGVLIGSLSFCSKGLHAYSHSLEAVLARTGDIAA